MTEAAISYIFLGCLFLVMGIGSSWIKRLPLTTAIIYLIGGIIIGPFGFHILIIDPLKSSKLLEHLTEIAVIVSLFTAGLKLREPLRSRMWLLPSFLAFGSMTFTVGLIAAAAHFLAGISPGASILLGAILAPTDPVLASDVQLDNPADKDNLKFSLTCEAGLNDGTAFPFVMLGLLLLQNEFSAALFSHWLLKDVLWAIFGGLGIGALIGWMVTALHSKVRNSNGYEVILDDFLALSLIALAYGTALLCKTYGFLAVFASAVTLRQLEIRESRQKPQNPESEMAREVLIMNEQFERLCEVTLVVLLGGMLSMKLFSFQAFIGAILLFLVIRPLSVMILKPFFSNTFSHFSYVSWFGIRGIGSLYYLMFSLQNGLQGTEAVYLIHTTFVIVTISIIIHGLSVTPLMRKYKKAPRLSS